MTDSQQAVAALFAGGDPDSPIASPRLARVARVSKNRYHNEIKLNHPDQVDAELVGWLRAAYALGE